MPRLRLAKVPTEVLKKELSRRFGALPKLIAERNELNRQIAELEALASAEKPPTPAKTRAPRKKGPRAKNAVSLVDALTQAMKGKESMSIPDAAQAVLASGYKSKSKDFANLVSMTLARDERFERVARGQYKVK